jgi:hypothetical protein
MHKLKLLCLTALAMFSFAAFAASAFATEPAILVSEGKISELEAPKLTGTNAELIQLSGEKSIKAANVTASIKGCEANLSEKDTNLCKDQPITFTGVKQGEVACRSENAKAEKDPVETVLVLLDLHAVSQKESIGKKELVPALQAKILGNALEEEVKFVCGTVKIQVKAKEGETRAGVIECLFGPGLKTTKKVEVLCKVEEKTGAKPFDPILGTCEVLCSDFGTVGLVADLDGKTFKDAWELIHLEGETTKEITIDD